MNAHRYDEDGNGGGWDEYKKLVLSQIREMREAHQDLCSEMRDSIQTIRDDIHGLRSETSDEMKNLAVDIGKLNVKAGMWGALAGAILSGGVLLAQVLAR